MGLLPEEPASAVTSVAELRALAAAEAEAALGTFEALARRPGEGFAAQRAVLEMLAGEAREALARAGSAGDVARLDWSPPDLLHDEEWSQLAAFERVTPYRLWAMAVRYGERLFAFWAYVAGRTEVEAVRREAESLAHAALRATSGWRRERREAWRAEAAMRAPALSAGLGPVADALSSAALIESLLVRDLTAWAAIADDATRRRLVEMAGSADPSWAAVTPEGGAIVSALRRAEHLVELYLGSADRADSEANLHFALAGASRAIKRLAALRELAEARGPAGEPPPLPRAPG